MRLKPGINLVKRPRLGKIGTGSSEDPTLEGAVTFGAFLLLWGVVGLRGVVLGFALIGVYVTAGVLHMRLRPPKPAPAAKPKPVKRVALAPAPVLPANPAVLALLRGLQRSNPDLELEALRGQSIGGFTPASIGRAIDSLR